MAIARKISFLAALLDVWPLTVPAGWTDDRGACVRAFSPLFFGIFRASLSFVDAADSITARTRIEVSETPTGSRCFRVLYIYRTTTIL